jgi:hypothetical protein
MSLSCGEPSASSTTRSSESRDPAFLDFGEMLKESLLEPIDLAEVTELFKREAAGDPINGLLSASASTRG